jgi:hypothetical protein
MRYLNLCKSAGFGALTSIALGVTVVVFGGQTAAVHAYLYPGVHMAGLVSPAVPTSLVYWIEPEGGPYAFLFLALVCAAVIWAVVFGSIHYAWVRRRRSS